MENIDITDWVRSALIIDDEWEEVKNLYSELVQHGISVSYYNPNPQKANFLSKSVAEGVVAQDFDSILEENHEDEEEYKEYLESILTDGQVSVDGILDSLDVRNTEDLEFATKALNALIRRDKIKAVSEELSYTRVKELTEDIFNNYDLIFLDIDLGFEEIPEPKIHASNAVTRVKNAVNKDCTPYGIVLWSKEPENPIEDNGEEMKILQYMKNSFYSPKFGNDKPKPLFIVDSEKTKYCGPQKCDCKTLFQEINEKLTTDKMAKYFACWETGVQSSSTETYHFMQRMAERLAESEKLHEIESSFLDLIKHATYMHFGFPRSDDEALPGLLARYSFCYISHILYDKLSSHFRSRDIDGIFLNGVDHLNSEEDTSPSINDLHKAFLKQLSSCKVELEKEHHEALDSAVKQAAEQEDTDVKVYDAIIAELNFLEVFDIVTRDVTQLPGVIYKNGKQKEIYIDITPPCDVANSKNDGRLFLEGEFHNHKGSLKRARNNYNSPAKARIWKTPPVLYQGRYTVLDFCLTRVIKKKEEGYEPVLRLKDSSFTDLMQKFGNYNSRLGATNFKP
ncbi:hypothetical protein [Pseudodesulfovibrio tunisiensis]|uniref:hypothetical protein n=1 Tax=Pseudodesulfovibrio tunisiensis TaxID=463192 RepID=UPI001FB23412|nr:hypothetical protein [Pseudodesulfovibrio tunisiensis]